MLIIEDKFLFVPLVTMPLIIDIHVYFLLRNKYILKIRKSGHSVVALHN